MDILPTYFIVSVLVTMFILYIIQPEPVVIVKYPSPKEEVSSVYVDDNNVYYRYYREEYKKSN
jgi:hypothetical protein